MSPRNVYHRWHHVITPKYSSEILRYFGCQGGMDVAMWVDSMGKAASSMWQGYDCPIPYGDLISRASYFMLISGKQMKVQSRARNVIGLVGFKLRHSKRTVTRLGDRDKMAANLKISNSNAWTFLQFGSILIDEYFEGSINNKQLLIQIIAWCWASSMQLSNAMIT